MAICNFPSTPLLLFPPRIPIFLAINPKRKSLRAAACNTTSHKNWNISKDFESQVKGHTFSVAFLLLSYFISSMFPNFYISTFPSMQEDFWADYKGKMEEMKQVLLQHSNLEEKNNRKDSLILVDGIQRLGLDHHFDEEIDMILGKLSNHNFDSVEHDLYDVSLHFRLLRNHGYHVSSDVFNNFKGNGGKFEAELRQDIQGLMELHEAAQLGFTDEDIIDEAENFSRVNLNKCLEDTKVDDYHKKMIKNTLRHPQHKNIARLTARNCMNGGLVKGCSNKRWGKTLTEFAKMDASMGELMHQEELLQVSKWWETVGIAEGLSRARSQPVKWYIWSMAMLIDSPSLRVERIELAKVIAFVYLIDDIFDLYGTTDELSLFTQAINRWEYSASDTLPEYMRKSYKGLLDTTNGIAQKVEDNYGTNPIDSFKVAWISLCSAFMLEARWFRSSELPRAKEYLENGQVSTGAHVILVHLFFLLGLGRGWSSLHLKDTSTLLSSVATICRLSDDLGTAQDEQQDGSDGSYLKCCMNDEAKMSRKEAQQHMESMISNQWKILNKECFLHLNDSSVTCFRRASLNSARMVPLMYTYDQNQRLMLLEQLVNTTKLFH